MKSKTIKLAIVDDHQIVIDGIKSLLHGQPLLTIVACTTSPSEMLRILQQEPIDILLTDVMMPEMNGYELSKQAKQICPGLKILALSMSDDGATVNSMINDADISGYVLKNIGKEELNTAIHKIANGGIYFTDDVLEEMNRASKITKNNEETHLTAREIEIVKLIEKELPNRAIADQLFISERTVETHRKNIFRKTKTNSVVGLVKYAYEHKLI